MTSATPVPTDITVKTAERRLDVRFDDGAAFSLPAEYLRTRSPSAEMKSETTGERRIIGGCRDVGIAAVEPVGNYAIQITFDDGHDTGIYSWQFLYELGTHQEAYWQRYLDALAERGLSREPRR